MYELLKQSDDGGYMIGLGVSEENECNFVPAHMYSFIRSFTITDDEG